METSENMLFSNQFGKITDKRIVLNYKSGAEDIPIGQISSVSFQRKQNYLFVVVNFLAIIITLIFILNYSDKIGGTEILMIIFLLLFFILSGIANWIGHHNIIISSGGKNRKPLKVEMAKTKEGKQFVDAVKSVIFQ